MRTVPPFPFSGAPSAFTLQAELAAPQLTLAQPASAGQGAIDLQLHDLRAQLSGSLPQLQASLDGRVRSGALQLQLQLHARAQGGHQGAGAWGLQLGEFQAQARDGNRFGRNDPRDDWRRR